MASIGGSVAPKSEAGSTMSKSKSETVNYLLLYEAMVRHQDLEFDATHDHLALTVARIQQLGRPSPGRGAAPATPGGGGATGDEPPSGMLTYLQMRRCLLRLGYAWNRSLLPSTGHPSSSASLGSSAAGSQPRYYYDYDDDVSVLSTKSAATFLSAGGASAGSATSGGMGSARDIIATDAQLIMLLTTLVEAEERSRAARMAAAEEEDGEEGKEQEDLLSQGLFLPEFIQAYKLIIGGMQSLQTFPEGDGPSLQDLRARSRDRTLGILRLFGPDSSLYKDDPYADVQRQSAGEDPATASKSKSGKKTTRDGLRQTSNRSRRLSKSSSLKAKDGLLPRLTEDEIRTMVHSKDAALAKILEEHESEMNLMANNMELLRREGIQTKRNIQRRRKRLRIAAALGLILLVTGGGYYEYRKREQVRVEIATGREVERKADAAIIAALEEEVVSLRSKLEDAEATIRYEEGRYAGVNEKYEKASKTLKESEMRWRSEGRELERCRVTRKELDAELTSAHTRNAEVEEEVGWCRERLEGAERAMDGMERALKKGRSGEEEMLTFADITKQLEVVDAGIADENTDGGEGDMRKKAVKNKPVAMEMKYNRSFRNGVILRQIYSAVAGMALGVLFPAAKIIGLFLK